MGVSLGIYGGTVQQTYDGAEAEVVEDLCAVPGVGVRARGLGRRVKGEGQGVTEKSEGREVRGCQFRGEASEG